MYKPINPDAWYWYNAVVGRNRCAIVDTYWQTETGSIVVTPLPGATKTKAGRYCCFHFLIEIALLSLSLASML